MLGEGHRGAQAGDGLPQMPFLHILLCEQAVEVRPLASPGTPNPARIATEPCKSLSCVLPCAIDALYIVVVMVQTHSVHRMLDAALQKTLTKLLHCLRHQTWLALWQNPLLHHADCCA